MERSPKGAFAFVNGCWELDERSAMGQELTSTTCMNARVHRTSEDSWTTKTGCSSRLPDIVKSVYGKEEWRTFLELLLLADGQLGTVLNRPEVVDVGGLQEVGDRQKKRLE